MNEKEKSLSYIVGKIMVMESCKYSYASENTNEDIVEPRNKAKVDAFHDMYNQAVIRMAGRAAQELAGLELCTEAFYEDLKLAIPYMKNIADLEGRYFPNVVLEEYKTLDESYYNRHILAAKHIITTAANMYNSTPDLLIRKVVANLRITINNEFN
jgi:hypothetical protein